MPVRWAKREAKRHVATATGHIWDNLLLWMGLFAAVGVLALVVRWGALAALAFMLVGILVMVASEKGLVLTHETPAEDDRTL